MQCLQTKSRGSGGLWPEAKTATNENGDIYFVKKKQNYAEYLLNKDVNSDKLLVVTLLCLIVRFFRLHLCKTNDTILRFQCVGFRCISYF